MMPRSGKDPRPQTKRVTSRRVDCLEQADLTREWSMGYYDNEPL